MKKGTMKVYRMLVAQSLAKCFHLGEGDKKRMCYVEFKNMVKQPEFIGATYKTDDAEIQEYLESLDDFGVYYDIDGKQPTKKSIKDEAAAIAEEREKFEKERAEFEKKKQEDQDRWDAEKKLKDAARPAVKEGKPAPKTLTADQVKEKADSKKTVEHPSTTKPKEAPKPDNQ